MLCSGICDASVVVLKRAVVAFTIEVALKRAVVTFISIGLQRSASLMPAGRGGPPLLSSRAPPCCHDDGDALPSRMTIAPCRQGSCARGCGSSAGWTSRAQLPLQGEAGDAWPHWHEAARDHGRAYHTLEHGTQRCVAAPCSERETFQRSRLSFRATDTRDSLYSRGGAANYVCRSMFAGQGCTLNWLKSIKAKGRQLYGQNHTQQCVANLLGSPCEGSATMSFKYGDELT